MKNKLVVVLVAMMSMAWVPSEVSARNVIRWASQGDALTADPHAANEQTTTSAARKVYDSLVYPDKDLNVIPWLATSWKLIDPTTWEFELRDGVKWHDGSSFTARDVKFSLDRARAETSDFKKQVDSIKNVEIVNDRLVRIITAGPNPILPNQLTTIFMMSKAWSEKHGVAEPPKPEEKDETYAVRHAMGTGPFRLQKREPGVRTIMVKHEAWWGLEQYPHEVDELVYTPIANPATRVAALLSGELDFVLDPPLQDLERIRRTPGLRLVQTAQDRTIFLGMNQGREELVSSDVKGANPLRDRRIRLALYQAIDINAIQDKIMRGNSMPAGVITAPAVHGYTKSLDERYPYDPAAARKLLVEAGYPEGFSIRLDCPNNRYINDEAICQAVAGMLGRIGVKVELSALPKTKHFPKVQCRKSGACRKTGKCEKSEQCQETDFYMLGWGVPTLDSHYVFSYLARESGWNATGFDDPGVNELIDQIGVEVDFDARDQAINTVWERMNHEIVYLPLHHQVVVWAMKDWLDLPVVADNGVRFIYATINKR